MAIKVAGHVAIANNKRADFDLVNFGSYSDNELLNLEIKGQAVGDTVYNMDKECTMSWNGSSWLVSVVGLDIETAKYISSFSIDTPTQCKTIGVIPVSNNNVGGRRNSLETTDIGSEFTFLSTLKFDRPDVEMWVALSRESDNVFVNKVGTRSFSDFPESTYPAGYSQKQLVSSGPSGEAFYTDDGKDEDDVINNKTLVYGSTEINNAIQSLFATEEVTKQNIHNLTGSYEIDFDDTTNTYSIQRSYYDDQNNRVNEFGTPLVDANGDLIVSGELQTRDNAAVHLAFLGSAKNGDTFELIEAKKEINLAIDHTMSWNCPEGKSLVGFFYVVKHPDVGPAISQPVDVLLESVDRASYLSSAGGVGSVVECKPGMDMSIKINNYKESGEPEWTGEYAKWSIRYAVWSVS